LNTINYYESVVSTLQGKQTRAAAEADAQKFVRLFMVPGMLHCGNGPGPNSFDMLTALENWTEKAQAPERVIAAHSTRGAQDRTRPLCVYPQVAKYKGQGSTDAAENFECKAP
jgi:feruloyl esterase